MTTRGRDGVWFRVLVAAWLWTGCSPADNEGSVTDVRRDVPTDGSDGASDGIVLEGDGGTCDPADCAARCAAAGFPRSECTAEGSCSCSSDPPVDGGEDAPPGEDAGTAEDGAVGDDAEGPEDAAVEDARPPLPSRCGENRSYIWIANSAEGTLSKLCTLDGVEVGRYVTSPLGALGDPSRTSVNLHGDMVVTNRSPGGETPAGPSSVTKFAAELEDCIDRDGDTTIRTSTGATDVLPWGEDECMIWNTTLPDAGSTSPIGARATAWDGTEDSYTGLGGHVWIGALDTGGVFKLDGDTGAVAGRTHVTNMPYGGAMDGAGNFWIVGGMCTVGSCRIVRVNTTTLATTYFTVPCGYGIAVDAFDRVWTSGKTMTGSCVNRLNPSTGENVTYTSPGLTKFYRGIAVDNAGSVWVASTTGSVVQVREADVTFVHEQHVGPEAVVGVAIDFEGNVWAVSQGGNAALKMHPATYAVESFAVGTGPYTYSDMTGYQLRTVILR
ncbi:MAG: hypothetical protein JXB32_00505 [Deltaproteobacteria bacterium]|nr:hypothetical protein [Deltaproteobacteria bacterium]